VAQYESTSPDAIGRSVSEPDDLGMWALGFISFAAVMMLLLGSFHMLAGLAAIFDESFYDPRPNFGLKMDTTVWGWVHLVSGIVLLIGSVGILFGSLWARILCIFFAVLSALFNFYSIPYYPVWSILMIALAVGVIWALLKNPNYGSFDTWGSALQEENDRIYDA
jgi:hypothetical protein